MGMHLSRRALIAALAALGLPVAAAFAVSGFAPSTLAPQATAAALADDDDDSGPADQQEPANDQSGDDQSGDDAAPSDDVQFCDDLAKDERKEAKENGDCKDRPAPKSSSSVPTTTVVISTVTSTTPPRALSTPGATH